MNLPNNFEVSLHKIPNNMGHSKVNGLILNQQQVEYIKVIKSMVEHSTKVEIKLRMIVSEVLNDLQEANLLIKINLMSKNDSGEDSFTSSINFFVPVETLEIMEEASNIGTQTFAITLILESVVLQRMRFENNLGFLGWVSDQNKIGTPIEYFLNIMSPIIEKTYFNPDALLPDSTLLSSNHTSVILAPASKKNKYSSATIPNKGYIFEPDNNFDIINYFFNRYAPFLTPSSWILDDFPMDNKQSSVLRLSNFYSSSGDTPTGWSINQFLSNTIMKDSTTSGDDIDLLMYFKMTHLGSAPFYNNWTFNQMHIDPVFQIIGSGEPELINTSRIKQYKNGLFVQNGQLLARNIQNPNVQKIFSFLNNQDIQLQKAYLAKFKSFNPQIDTFSFKNVPAWYFDMSKAVQFNSSIYGTTQDRLGYPYNVTLIYTNQEESTKADNTIDSRNDGCNLDIEVDFLTINDFKDNLESLVLNSEEINNLADNFLNKEPVNYGPIRKEYIRVGTSADGNDITRIAQEMHDKLPKFRYFWGGANASTGYDCSGYVMTAVCRATGLKRYGAVNNVKGFPKLAETQRRWCERFATRINKLDVQAGDIIFLKSSHRVAARHVGIARSNTEVLHSSGGQKCSASNTCKGPAVGKINQPVLDQWDKSFYGAYRIQGDGTENVQVSTSKVGKFCDEFAKIESTNTGGKEGYEAFNARTKAAGRYQFMPRTQQDVWTRLLRRSGDVPNKLTPELQDEFCIAYEDSIIKSLKNHNIPINFFNVYLAWQQGLTGSRYILAAAKINSDANLSKGIINNMKSNMHGSVYTGVKSYLTNLRNYMIIKKANPDFTG